MRFIKFSSHPDFVVPLAFEANKCFNQRRVMVHDIVCKLHVYNNLHTIACTDLQTISYTITLHSKYFNILNEVRFSVVWCLTPLSTSGVLMIGSSRKSVG